MKSVKKILLSLLLGCFFCAPFWSEETEIKDEENGDYRVDMNCTTSYYYRCESPKMFSEDPAIYMVLASNPKEYSVYVLMFENCEDANKFCGRYYGIVLYSHAWSDSEEPEKALKAINEEIADFMQPYIEDWRMSDQFLLGLQRIKIVRVYHSENTD